MSEENGSKGCIIAVVWLVLLAILGGAVWFLYTKPKNEQLNQDTGSSSQYTHELSIAADLFSGYAVLRSAQMRDNLKSDGIRLTMVDDGADYGARLEALEDGDVQMAVYTIDSLMMAGAKAGSFPASIVMLIDETKGADAVLAYKSAVASLHDLDDSTARFVLTPSSPSEFLARVVKSHFQLPNLSGDWMIEADGAAAVLKKMKSAKQSDKTAYVMWEPQVSQAKQLPGVEVILDSSKINGLIIDVLVARREYLRDHPDKVRAVIEAYSRAAHYYRSQTGGFAKLVKLDDPSLSDDEAKSLVNGIQWKNTLENYAHFGLVSGVTAGDLLSLEDMIANVTDVLIKTDALENDPLGGRHSSLYFDQILTDMKTDNFHPANRMNLIKGLGQGTGELQGVRTNAHVGSLSDGQWNTLQAVGDLDVPSIGFRRGSAAVSLSSEHELKRLKKKLDSFPNFYLRVVGHARAVGDPEANRRLAESRAESVVSFLMGVGVNADRIRTEAAPAASRAGSVQSVRFELGQVPY
jgi:ABC-type nitrate/sulfonate/bicarbonate transport system substrate-binding protein/outer membrane protein OmpA-like peptidoglycan-associated protein